MKIFYRVLFIMIAICVPTVAISGALNIVFRAPDLYAFEFTRNQAAREIDLSMSNDDLGGFFSDFMRGQEKDFVLFTEYRSREQGVFGTIEQGNMENARKLLNLTLYGLGAAVVLTVFGCGVFLRQQWRRELRAAFK
ncbi:MAG: hypothetical protein LBJ82_03765, partial [Deltaproteobacteria bacterium]|nr:hypothetical protein [Deltaproteobacteria bacterium]